MAFLIPNRDAAVYDSTPVDNRFLLEYLPSAPENFLRVYLALRMVSLHPELGASLSEMATFLRMTEEEIGNALDYWDHEGLVQRTSDVDASYMLMPFSTGSGYTEPNERRFYKMRDFNGSVQQLFDLSKGSDYIIAPKYYEIIDDWLNILNIPQEGILLLLKDELRSGSKRPAAVINRLNRKLGAWSKEEKPMTTLPDVERLIATESYAASVAARVLKQLSITRKPSLDEVKLADKWVNAWALNESEIIEACADTTKSRNPSMAYLDSILSTRRMGGDSVFRPAKAILSELGHSDTKPTPDQLLVVAGLLEAGFETETLLLAAVQCARSNRHRFEDFVWMIEQWRKNALFKQADAEAFVQEGRRNTDAVKRLLEMAGSGKRPGKSDIDAYLRWKTLYDPALIDYAATCAAGMQMPIHYMDKVLSEWGNISVDEARARHEEHARGQKNTSAAANPALNYAQRTVSDADFEHIFVDLNSDESEENHA